MSSLQFPVYKQFLAKLASVDFYEIARLLKSKGWKRKRIDKAISIYCKYLFLTYQKPNQILTPTKEVDEVLHSHIALGTQFNEDCQRLFGRALAHQADFENGDDANLQAWLATFQQTKQLFQQLFGLTLTDDPAHCYTKLASLS